MSIKQGVTTAGSPSAGHDEKLDDVVDQVDTTEAESSTATDEQDSESSPETVKKPGEADPVDPTPLEKLRGKLTAEPPKDEKDDTAADDADVADDQSEDDSEQPGDTDGDQPTKKPEDGKDGAFKGFTPEERNALGRKASARIVELNNENKTHLETLKKKDPIIKAGEFIERIRTQHGLEPQEVVESLALSAAFKRGDPQAVEALEASAEQLRADLGLPLRVAATPAVKPFVGALPQQYRDMIEVLGFDEAKVRFLYGAEKAQEEAETVAAAAKANPPPVQRQRQAAPQHQAPQRAVTVAGFDQSEAAAADDAVADFLQSKGVKDAKAHMKALMPLMSQRAPVNPDTGKPDHRFIAPERRVKAVEIAHQRFVIAEAKRKADAKQNSVPIATGSAPPVSNRSQAPATATPLDSLKRKMVAGARR